MCLVQSKLQASWETSLSLAGVWKRPPVVEGASKQWLRWELSSRDRVPSVLTAEAARSQGPDHELPLPGVSLLGRDRVPVCLVLTWDFEG